MKARVIKFRIVSWVGLGLLLWGLAPITDQASAQWRWRGLPSKRQQNQKQQPQSSSQDVLPTRTLMPDAVVTESTLDVFPQIRESVQTKPFVVRNPRFPKEIQPWPLDTQLVLGKAGGYERNNPVSRFAGISATGSFPPDPSIGVGLNNIVATVNTDIAFFTKSGLRQFQQPLAGTNGFFGSVGMGEETQTNVVGDPKVFYDQIAGRFGVIVLEINFGTTAATQTSRIYFAISSSEDPNGSWNKYRVTVERTIGTNKFWGDYPGWGYNKDGFVCHLDMLPFTQGASFGQIIVIPKPAILAGAQPTISTFDIVGQNSAQIAHTMDSTEPNAYLVYNRFFIGSVMTITAIRNIPTTPTISTIDVNVPNYRTPFNLFLPTLGGLQVDSLADRVLSAMIRGGRLVFAHGNQVGTQQKAEVRWYDVRTNGWPVTPGATPSLAQSGSIQDSNESLFMPAIAINRNNDIALIYSATGAATRITTRISSRKDTDPVGTLSNSTQIAVSQGNYGPQQFGRYGDYYALVVDPLDDVAFWGNSETIGANGDWTTDIQSFTVSGGAPPITILPVPLTIYRGNLTAGALANINVSGYATLGTIASSDGERQESGLQGVFNLGRPPAQISKVTIQVEGRTDFDTTNPTVMVYALNLNTGSYDFIKAAPLLGTADNTLNFDMTSGFSNYVTPAGVLSVIVRGHTATNPAGAARAHRLSIKTFKALPTFTS